MAGEEDVELRDLVAQTLEAKGVLGKIRAELRASVFAALEEQNSQEKTHPLVNEKLQKYLQTKEGQLATGLVREFLEFFELDFTCAVFDPETNVLDTYPGRDKLARDIGIDSKTSTTSPLLTSVLQRSTTQSPFLRQLHFTEPPSTTFAATKASFPLPTITESVRSTAPIHIATDSIPSPSLTSSSKTSAVGESIHLGSESQRDTLTTVTGSSSSPRVLDSKLNSNENSNLRLGSVPASHPKVPRVELGKPTLGEGINTNIPGVHTELGEVFMNSSHDKLLGLTGEGIGRLMKQPEEVESTRDELDDFFDTAQPPLDLFPKDKAKQLRSEDKGISAAGKKPESLSSLKGAPVLTRNGGNPLEFGSRVSKLATSDGAGGDESHSEDDISEQFEEGSGKYETTDYTISDHSLTGSHFDHTEPVQS